jgi:hypothetical protein
VIAPGWAMVAAQRPCLPATLHRPDENPFLPIDATDDRGTVFGFDFAAALSCR